MALKACSKRMTSSTVVSAAVLVPVIVCIKTSLRRRILLYAPAVTVNVNVMKDLAMLPEAPALNYTARGIST
jgi:hypothetical protein